MFKSTPRVMTDGEGDFSYIETFQKNVPAGGPTVYTDLISTVSCEKAFLDFFSVEVGTNLDSGPENSYFQLQLIRNNNPYRIYTTLVPNAANPKRYVLESIYSKITLLNSDVIRLITTNQASGASWFAGTTLYFTGYK